LTAAGCQHCGPRPQAAPCAGPAPFPGPAPVYSPAAPLPRSPTTLPDAPLPPAPPGPVQSKSPDLSQDLTWKPGNGPTVRLYPPEVVESQDGGTKPPGRPPEVFENDKPAPKVEMRKPEVPNTGEPPRAEAGKSDKSAGFPVGIAQFARVNDLAAGLRPSLDDGLDWLRDSGFKTVIYVHEPGASHGADRKQVERRGMKFISLEVSPQGINKKLLEEFSALVGEQANLPLFVYDSDGARAGALWYLYFRVAQRASEDSARTQARNLGLRDDREGLHREMFDAAQRYVSDRQD
jgi:protein tyrosine phosphatase (PTP) superfamily phosphohydrolase (DUF442 family)